tara:strand:- start:45 stop:1382 length:1338 start_codon:yes stop_codon:yes gene_type:complete
MPKRCTNITDPIYILDPGATLLPGSELIDGTGQLEPDDEIGSVMVNEIEELPPRFIQDEETDGIVKAGEHGAVAKIPVDDMLFTFTAPEEVPPGTKIISGCCLVNGDKICAPPPFIAVETTIADEPSPVGIVPDDVLEDYKKKGFCNDWAFDMPGGADLDLLNALTDVKLPDLQGMGLSGFTAFITKMMSQLGEILGKLQMEIDEMLDMAVIDPEKICTPPVKKDMRKLMRTIERLMKLIPTFKRIIQIIKMIQNAMKAISMAMNFIGLPYIPGGLIVKAMVKALNFMGLVDMMIGILVSTAGRFVAVIPILFAQLMGILAQCAAQQGQEPPTNKKECEALGGTWIEQSEIDGLKNMLDDLNNASSDILGGGEDGKICYCTIVSDADGNIIESESDCVVAGGQWKCIDSTDIDSVGDLDLSALEKELENQFNELQNCLTDADFKL